jgi:hypothetical protein
MSVLVFWFVTACELAEDEIECFSGMVVFTYKSTWYYYIGENTEKI